MATGTIKGLKVKFKAVSFNSRSVGGHAFTDITVDEDPPPTLIGVVPMYSGSPVFSISNIYYFDGSQSHDIADGFVSGYKLRFSIVNVTANAQTLPAASNQKVEFLEIYY